MARRWSEAELISALALYYQIPFGAIDQRNRAIITLANELDRTPGSVGLKLANFASLDPAITGTGRRGMANASVDDRRTFGLFGVDSPTLHAALSEEVSKAIERRRPPLTGSSQPTRIADRPVDSLPTEDTSLVVVRKGQQFFRNTVLAAYRERCCITDVPVRELLRASHIVPWSVDASSRLDPSNGMCLSALHDAAFDRGLITFNADRRLVLSRRLSDQMDAAVWKEWFGRYEGVAMKVPERFLPRADALAYHRETIFVRS